MSAAPSPAPPLAIVNARTFDAPRATVFAAFENPALLAQWWGPDGFTNTIRQFDFRPGGAWRYVMHGPNGADYDNASDFVEIVRPEKIVLLHLRPLHRFQLAMSYADASGGRTELTWRMTFERTPENEKLSSFLHAANDQNLARLAAALARAQP